MSLLESNSDFEALLNYLKQNRGCDLTGYKRSTLMRRFQHRMQQLGIETYSHYLHTLRDDLEECSSLLDTIWINVSGFFRDADSWDYLAKEIIPKLIASKQPQKRIRVWSAGCASGQEVYSLAMLLAEALGMEQYLQRVQIFATDIDDDALKQARQASYSNEEIESIPIGLRSKYTEPVEQHHVVQLKLRRSIVFGRHDLAVDAPMSKIDLLVCRNVLIYFTPQTQASILVRFHFALADNRFFFLGNSEYFTSNRHLFTPVSFKHHMFAKEETLTLEDHLQLRPRTRNNKVSDFQSFQSYIRQAAFEVSPFAQLVVDRKGCLLLINQKASTLFGLQNSDLGTHLQELEAGQHVDLWAPIQRLEHSRNPVKLSQIRWVTQHGTRYLDVHIAPISGSNDTLLGANLTFILNDTHDVWLRDNHQPAPTLASATPIQTTNGASNIIKTKPESTQK